MKNSFILLSVLCAWTLSYAGPEYSCEGSAVAKVAASDGRVSLMAKANSEKGRVVTISGRLQGYPNYPKQPSLPSYPHYPSFPSAPSFPPDPVRPSLPSYPQYPSLPSYPSYPSWPSQPSVPYPASPSHPSHPQGVGSNTIDFNAGIDRHGRISFIKGRVNGRPLHFSRPADLKNPEVAKMFDAVARNLPLVSAAAGYCSKGAEGTRRKPGQPEERKGGAAE